MRVGMEENVTDMEYTRNSKWNIAEIEYETVD
jgi:hypothetical protein